MVVQSCPATLIFTSNIAFNSHAGILAATELLRIHSLHKKKNGSLDPESHIRKRSLDCGVLWGRGIRAGGIYMGGFLRWWQLILYLFPKDQVFKTALYSPSEGRVLLSFPTRELEWGIRAPFPRVGGLHSKEQIP